MFARALLEIRRSSPMMKAVLIAVAVASLLFCASMLLVNAYRGPATAEQGAVADYRGFMVDCAARGVLPLALLLQLIGGVRYGVFERCRKDPTRELRDNFIWLVIVSVGSGIWSVVLFGTLEFLVLRRSAVDGLLTSVLGMVLVQTVMMVASVSLLVLLLVNCGLSFGQVVPAMLGFFMMAAWLFAPLIGDVTRYVYYFWYPIAPSWSVVAVNQIMPFVGYCVFMRLGNVMAFDRTDRLGE